jgi:ParB-like chromosome segregation protein Spo0J
MTEVEKHGTHSRGRFQVMPDLSPEEYAALKNSIAERGVEVPIVEDAAGNIIDGHHRKRAWEELKALGFDLADLPRETRTDLGTDQAKRDLALSLNLQRRHLNRQQRKEVISSALKATPERSDRWLADVVGADHKTISSVRRHLEVRGEIPQVNRLYGKDGKSYVRLRGSRYEDEDRRRDQERKAEAHLNVRKALRQEPERPDQDIADEFDVTVDFVADNRDDLAEHGARPSDVFATKGEDLLTPTHKDEQRRRRESQERTKKLKDEGKLKEEDAKKAFETVLAAERLLKLGHENPNRRITPEDAADAYLKSSGLEGDDPLAEVFAAHEESKLNENLERLVRLQEWLEGFIPVFTKRVDTALQIAKETREFRTDLKKRQEEEEG